MQTKVYHARRKSIYRSLSEAALISLVLSFLIVGFIVGSFTYNPLFYMALFSAIFIVTSFTLSPISGYYTSISEDKLTITSFKNVNVKEFYWDRVGAVSVGMVYNKYSRYNNAYYGVEVLSQSEFKNLTATYKLDHLENHEELMDEIIKICKEKNIEHMDLRKV